MRLYRTFWLMLVLMAAVAVVHADLVTNTIASSDFETDNDGWHWSGSNTVVTAGGGFGGSAGLWAATSTNASHRLNLLNDLNLAYQGNYITSGVITLSFDAMNPASHDDALQLYALVYDYGRPPPGNVSAWVSTQFAAVTNDGIWRTFEISLRATDVVSLYGSATYNEMFSDVQMLSLRHQADGDGNGGAGSSLSSANNGLFIDNIKLTGVVPEPAVAGFITCGGIFMLGIKRLIRKRESDDSTTE